MSFYAGGNDTSEKEVESFFVRRISAAISDDFHDDLYDHTHEQIVNRETTTDEAGTLFHIDLNNYTVWIEIGVVENGKP